MVSFTWLALLLMTGLLIVLVVYYFYIYKRKSNVVMTARQATTYEEKKKTSSGILMPSTYKPKPGETTGEVRVFMTNKGLRSYHVNASGWPVNNKLP